MSAARRVHPGLNANATAARSPDVVKASAVTFAGCPPPRPSPRTGPTEPGRLGEHRRPFGGTRRHDHLAAAHQQRPRERHRLRLRRRAGHRQVRHPRRRRPRRVLHPRPHLRRRRIRHPRAPVSRHASTFSYTRARGGGSARPPGDHGERGTRTPRARCPRATAAAPSPSRTQRPGNRIVNAPLPAASATAAQKSPVIPNGQTISRDSEPWQYANKRRQNSGRADERREVPSAAGSGVAEAEQKTADHQGAHGQADEQARADPGADREAAQTGPGRKFQSGGDRGQRAAGPRATSGCSMTRRGRGTGTAGRARSRPRSRRPARRSRSRSRPRPRSGPVRRAPGSPGPWSALPSPWSS